MPFIPFVPSPPPSPRAHELGRRLKEAIDSFRREHPDMSATEIGQAVRLAMKGVSSKSDAAVIGLVAGLAILGVLVFLLLGRKTGAAGSTAIVPIIVAVAIVAVGVAAFVRNR